MVDLVQGKLVLLQPGNFFRLQFYETGKQLKPNEETTINLWNTLKVPALGCPTETCSHSDSWVVQT